MGGKWPGGCGAVNPGKLSACFQPFGRAGGGSMALQEPALSV